MILVLNSGEKMEAAREREMRVGNERKKVGFSSWNVNQHKSLLAVSHEILPSTNFYSTKRVLALEVLSRRDLHYERSLMKE